VPFFSIKKKQRDDDAWLFFVSSSAFGSDDARAEKTDGGERFFVGFDRE